MKKKYEITALIILFILSTTIYVIGLVHSIQSYHKTSNLDYLKDMVIPLTAAYVSVISIFVSTKIAIDSSIEKKRENLQKNYFYLNTLHNSLKIQKVMINKSLVPFEHHENECIENNGCFRNNKILQIKIQGSFKDINTIKTITINKLKLFTKIPGEKEPVLSVVSVLKPVTFELKIVSEEEFVLAVYSPIENNKINNLVKKCSIHKSIKMFLMLDFTAQIEGIEILKDKHRIMEYSLELIDCFLMENL